MNSSVTTDWKTDTLASIQYTEIVNLPRAGSGSLLGCLWAHTYVHTQCDYDKTTHLYYRVLCTPREHIEEGDLQSSKIFLDID